ncbi:uncharacterized protein K02A2.6-like [Xyrauchen texanus]|uniref:uncharacterized protein K02A2.6-like n=1 Tax=Xyrauchen texanus TaxID=154827 RepID=UPI002241D49C|nr:uncharacterized protein K02A2.6-like [Xyrauchen texanus]
MLDKAKLKTELFLIYENDDCKACSLFQFFMENKLQGKFTKTVSLLKILITTPMTTAESEREGLGLLKVIEATVSLKPQFQPRFCHARNVPYALKPKVEAELNRLLELGVISPVTCSEWATPIVPVVKRNGDVRICGDFKVTVNPALCVDRYPIPRIEDLFSSLAGGQRFTKLDLSNAYLQVPLAESSRKCLTITSSKGLFCYNRLPFGIASAPAIFQRAMDQILQGLSNVHCYLDDILVMGSNDEQHLKNVEAVLSRLDEFGLCVQREKCEFFKDSLEYLGHKLKGRHLELSRKFTLLTDHRPLTTIFSPTKAIPSMAAARMQRWALLLAAYDYDIQYRVGAHHGNADGLSRLPLQNASQVKLDTVELLQVKHLDSLPVLCSDVCKETRSDATMSQVMEMVATGQFSQVTDANNVLAPYVNRKDELTTQQGCLMWGWRVVIPPKLRSRVLAELHTGHPGIVRMKAVARSYVWWPGIDAQIEQLSKTCHSCQTTQKAPGPSPLHPWKWLESPWQRIHVDFAGPFEGHMYLVVVDAYSKWPEVCVMESTTSTKTIQVLRGLFSRYGLPEVLVSDNGPQFTSEEFQTFLKSNGVTHTRSAPFHPATNGLAERLVQTFKWALRCSKGPTSIQQRLDTFLLAYRNTPHATTKESPAMLFLHRRLRSRLDLLKPNVASVVEKAQIKLCQQRQVHAKDRTFSVGDKVLVRDYRRGKKWTPGVVSVKTGPVSYTVDVGFSVHWRRHVDQMLARLTDCNNGNETGPEVMEVPEGNLTDPCEYPRSEETSPPSLDPIQTGSAQPVDSFSSETGEVLRTPHKESRRYPERTIKPPIRFSP